MISVRARRSIGTLSVLLAGLLVLAPAYAQQEEYINLNDGELEIPITRFNSASFNSTSKAPEKTPLLLWLPSAYGTTAQQAIRAKELAKAGFDVWIVDLHGAYFVDAGRHSEEQFKRNDIAQLISIASQQSRGRVYVMATDEVSRTALQGIARYQQQSAQSGKAMRVGGAILFEPKLSYGSSEPGTPAQYFPVTKNSTIPIYYIQPVLSTRQWRSQDTVHALQEGGSQVFLRSLKGVGDGFHLRPDDELSDADLAQRAALPEELKRAVQLLSIMPAPAAPKVMKNKVVVKNDDTIFGLRILNDRRAAKLSLDDLDSRVFNVNYSKASLTLISFWASWCEPCIAELPALKRLYARYADKGMNFVLINVGEEPDAIRHAIAKYKLPDYQYLRDPEGKTMKAWNVYGFPTNFLVTPDGTIAMASFGAVEWDEPEVREALDGLLGI